MDSITEGIKKTLLAGVGAAALTFEKSSEIVDTLVKKGELTVEQGKTINQELKHKAQEKKEAEKDDAKDAEKKDFKSIVDGLSAEELEELKKALSEKEKKED